MNDSPPPSDAEHELNELRRRAYGRNPDIEVDPPALARLTELEAARTARPTDDGARIGEPVAAPIDGPGSDIPSTASAADRPDSAAGGAPVAESGDGSPRSVWHRLTAPGGRRSALVVGLVAGALVAVPVIADTVASLVGPHPDATLRPVEDEADSVVRSMLSFLGVNSESSSIRGYEPHRGFEPWYFEEEQGFQCFMLIHRPTQSVDGANCVPPGVDLFADIGAWRFLGSDYLDDLAPGSIIRFHYRGDSVDVFVYPASEAD